MDSKTAKRTRQTNRRVWKLRILQHIARRRVCWESMPNIARSLRIGRKRLTKYLDELRRAGLVETEYRDRRTNIHRCTDKGFRIFPSLIDDLRLPPKQANALTALFTYNEIPLKDIAADTLCSINTARRAVWKASKAGLLKITQQSGFEHFYSWTFPICKALRRTPTKCWREPIPKVPWVKPVVVKSDSEREKLAKPDATVIQSGLKRFRDWREGLGLQPI